jgi:hypothetical protein
LLTSDQRERADKAPPGAVLTSGSRRLERAEERTTGFEPATSSLGSWRSTN